jgi:predicted nucleic acid-binding protein
VITYVDTSVLLTLLIDDESGTDAAERLWLESDFVVCVEIGYVEARAALAAARRARRLDTVGLSVAKVELDSLWSQIDIVPVTTPLVAAAADLAERDGLRGYDALHLAAALASAARVLATADAQLLAAARRHHLDVANPLPPHAADP